jgi:hypothetical protein
MTRAVLIPIRTQFTQEISMKHNIKTAVPYALAAGTLALALGGCGTFDRDRTADRSADRYANRTVDRTSTYVETDRVVTANAPAVVDPFSPRYAAFPAMTNESAGVSGHSFYCAQHYNQPGCQTFDTAAAGSDRRLWRERSRSDAGDSARSGDAASAGRY